MFRAVGQPDDFQRGFDLPTTLAAIQLREEQRQFHILGGGQDGNQVEGLENETHVLVAPVGELRFVQLGHVHALHETFAAGRPVHAGDEVKQGGFAGTARAHEREKFPGGDVEGDAVERGHLDFALGIKLGQFADFDDRVGHRPTFNVATAVKTIPIWPRTGLVVLEWKMAG